MGLGVLAVSIQLEIQRRRFKVPYSANADRSHIVKKLLLLLLANLAPVLSPADDFRVSSLASNGTLTLSNAFTNGVITVERASNPAGPWAPEKNYFSVCSVTQVNVGLSGAAGFFRPLAGDISGTAGFTNLTESYGLLTTIAGTGAVICENCPNNWDPSAEGGPATNATLSSPHIAMADRAGNVYIADKDAQAIRKITLDGNIHTVAGTGAKGLGTTNPARATAVDLNNPNGLFVQLDGTFYILDRDNGFIRKVDTNGNMTLTVDNGGIIFGGRGLWVSPDASVLYYASGPTIKTGQVMIWDSTNGLSIFASGFGELGNLTVDPGGHLVITLRLGYKVIRFEADGTQTVIAGNGNPGQGGGDGQLATATGLNEVRAIAFLPNGAFFLGTDSGSQMWYVDTDGYIHLWLNGASFAYAGDGEWFFKDPATPKVNHVRGITMDYEGNLLIAESLSSYIRKIGFSRLQP